jgi:hypothetical protein
MELIPIIKYAFTLIAGVAFFSISISYIIYKIKNGVRNEQLENYQAVVQAPQPMVMNVIQRPERPVHIQSSRNTHAPKKMLNKKPIEAKNFERFKVLNEQPEFSEEKKPSKNNFVFKNPYTDQSFNA